MRIKSRCLSLLLSFMLLVLPALADPDPVSGYDNNTVEPEWNEIQNSSYYFNSNTGLGCVAAGEAANSGEEVSAEYLVEGITFLTNSTESELFPVWTPDGNYIMYTVKNESGSFDSYRMKANGSEIERTGIGEENLIGFSDINPNGTELIITKSIESQSGLYLVNLENGNVIRVKDDNNKSEGWGVWCRLGRKIVYTQESKDAPSELWRIDREGTNSIRLGTSENIGVGKDWCPLGLRVLYSAKDSKEKDDLWAIDWYGTNQTQLTDTAYGEWNPSFSPDGKKIVYLSDEGGKPEIWIRDIEGRYRARLTDDIGIVDSIPKWSPDGLKIVFTANKARNNSDNFANNNSDIAVIKLTPIFAISPNPKITSVKANSVSEISREGAANISISVKNAGANASEGYIWVFFPERKNVKSVEGTGSNIKVYSEGNLIQGRNGEISVQYPSVELVKYAWDKEQEETLNITITPNNESEEIVFYVRAALKNDITGNYSRFPLLSADFDQQGFEVYRYSMHVS
jgi:TolB protein